MARAGSEHQRDPVLVGEGPGRPVVLDKQEATVLRVSVEEDRVVNGQLLRNSFGPTQFERHRHIAAFGVDQVVGLEVNGKGTLVAGNGDVFEVVILEVADPLVQIVRGNFEIGSREAKGRIEVRESDLETTADTVWIDLEVEVTTASVVGGALGRGPHGDHCDEAPPQVC